MSNSSRPAISAERRRAEVAGGSKSVSRHDDVDDLALILVRECVLISRLWRVRLDERLRSSDITMARATVLYWISKAPKGVSQRELADMVGIEGPTLVRLLHALDRQGLIKRIPSMADRRVKTVTLTPAADPFILQIEEESSELIRTHLDKLDRRRLQSVSRLIRAARVALDRV